ncbi:BRCT domain-containing protein [Powellomyces hirtus]|nr:BRCT domain-containing protein [Powellomyces hirtus]
MVTSLGGQTAGDWHECSHLVTDRIRRTVKFLCALSAGKHIVNLKWLDASKKAGKFVAEDKYLLKDAKTEKQYGFRLVKSIAIAHDTTTPRIFSGLEFYSTAAVKPPREELKEILVAAGANLIDKPPPFRAGDKTVIIGHPDDGEEVKELQLAGWTVHSSEFVLTGLLRMEVDYTRYVDVYTLLARLEAAFLTSLFSMVRLAMFYLQTWPQRPRLPLADGKSAGNICKYCSDSLVVDVLRTSHCTPDIWH